MTIYIAAPWPLRSEAQALCAQLREAGVAVRATWLDRELDELPGALADLADITLADALVLLNPEEYRDSGTGGRHVETGYALALGRKVFILGVRSNGFHALADDAASGVEELVGQLRRWEKPCIPL